MLMIWRNHDNCNSIVLTQTTGNRHIQAASCGQQTVSVLSATAPHSCLLLGGLVFTCMGFSISIERRHLCCCNFICLSKPYKVGVHRLLVSLQHQHQKLEVLTKAHKQSLCNTCFATAACQTGECNLSCKCDHLCIQNDICCYS